jgi:O-antigen/teichoic acid export membrane protein
VNEPQSTAAAVETVAAGPLSTALTSRNPVMAGGWSGVSFIAGNAIGAFAYIPLARILGRDDFGLYAEANLLYLALVLLAEGSVVQALVQVRGDEMRLARAAFWLSVVISVIGTALCIAGAPLMARIYDERPLLTMLVLMSPGVLASGLGSVPHALLSREMDFRRKTLPETASVGLGGLCALVAAISGLGVYSLAIWAVIGPVVSTVIAWRLVGVRLDRSRPDAGAMRQMIRLWAGAGGGDVALYARLNTDYALTGRILGKDPLGVYSIAWSTSAGPQLFIHAFTGRVGFAVFSKLQHDVERLRLVFLSSITVIAAAALPVFLSAIVAAPDLVIVTLGSKWEAAIVPVMILFGLQLVRTVCTPGASLVLAMGHSYLYAFLGLAVLPGTVVAILLGTRGGVTGVAVGMTVAVGATSILYMVVAMRLLRIGPGALLRTFHTGVVLTVRTVPVVLLIEAFLRWPWEAPAFIRLALEFGAALIILSNIVSSPTSPLRAEIAKLQRALPEDDPDPIDEPRPGVPDPGVAHAP